MTSPRSKRWRAVLLLLAAHWAVSVRAMTSPLTAFSLKRWIDEHGEVLLLPANIPHSPRRACAAANPGGG